MLLWLISDKQPTKSKIWVLAKGTPQHINIFNQNHIDGVFLLLIFCSTAYGFCIQFYDQKIFKAPGLLFVMVAQTKKD